MPSLRSIFSCPTFGLFGKPPAPDLHVESKEAKMQSGGHTPVASMTTSRTATPSNLNPNQPASDVPKRTKICVYCGSAKGFDPAHMEAARQLARAMAENNISLGMTHGATSPAAPYPLPASLLANAASQSTAVAPSA